MDYHACDLAGDDVVGDTVGYFVVKVIWKEAEEVVVHTVEIGAVLPRVVETLAGDLRELAGAVETGLGEGVDGVGVDAPVGGR